MSLELVRLLLEWKADPNVVQAGGWTPLHQAAAHGREEIAKLLLEHGASLTAKSEDGRTPLEMARAKGHECPGSPSGRVGPDPEPEKDPRLELKSIREI